MPAPDHLTARRELVQQGRAVCRDTAWQHKRLDRARGQHRSGQLLHGTKDALGASQTCANSLPRGEETGQVDGRYGLDLGAEGGQRAATKGAQGLGVAEIGAVDAATGLDRAQLALHDPARGHEPAQDIGDHRHPESEPPGDIPGGERAMCPGVAGHQVAQRVGRRLEKGLGHPRR